MFEQTDIPGRDAQILHPSSRRLFRYWEGLRAERAYPAREDIEFPVIKDLLPDMVVIDRDYIRGSFRFRLAGSHVCALFDTNLTGTDVTSGWPGFERAAITKHLEACIRDYQPAVLRVRLGYEKVDTAAAELLLLPVQMRAAETLQIMGGVFSFRPQQQFVQSALISRELVSTRTIWTEHSTVPRTAARAAPVLPRRPVTRNFRLIEGGKA